MDDQEPIVAAILSLAHSITPMDALPAHDATGGSVASVTEALLSVSYGLHAIADAIRERGEA